MGVEADVFCIQHGRRLTNERGHCRLCRETGRLNPPPSSSLVAVMVCPSRVRHHQTQSPIGLCGVPGASVTPSVRHLSACASSGVRVPPSFLIAETKLTLSSYFTLHFFIPGLELARFTILRFCFHYNKSVTVRGAATSARQPLGY